MNQQKTQQQLHLAGLEDCPDQKQSETLRSKTRNGARAKMRALQNLWYAKNKQRIQAKRRAKRAADKERGKVRKQNRNPERRNAVARAWKKANRDKVNATRWLAHLRNGGSFLVGDCYGTTTEIALFSKADRQHANAWLKHPLGATIKWRKMHERMKRTPHLRAKFYLRKRVKSFLRGSRCSVRSRDLFGCTPQELVAHIEAQFQPGMTWANHGLRGWHIDHIIPCSSFDLTQPEQVRKCCHFSNLRPLWASENRAKGDAILPEFAHMVAA